MKNKLVVLTLLCFAVVIFLASTQFKTHAQQSYTVTFDDLPPGFNLINYQHPKVRFSAPAGYSALVLNNWGYSRPVTNPNFVVSTCNNCYPYTGNLNIEFTSPVKDFSIWLSTNAYYSMKLNFHIYEDNVYARTIPTQYLTSAGTPQLVDLTGYGNRITKVIIEPFEAYQTGVAFDNLSFTTLTNSSIGHLDGVANSQGAAVGWSVDPDNQSASNNVDCHIDGNYIGVVAANLPSPDLSYPGNHRFSFPIPFDYRDGNQHQISCYGLDVTGSDPPKILGGSPHTFKFNAPIGYLDGIDADGNAYGWSQDPDVPAQSNRVQFHIDGVLVGETVANIPGPGVSPGDHGFQYSIPAQYRNNLPHTISAYGIDLTGDKFRILQGSPKTFTLSPVVQSLEFKPVINETINNQLSNSEIGAAYARDKNLRIFTDAKFPGDSVNHRTVRVQATVGQPNVTVHFKNYDVDDPSSDSIIDENGTIGDDNYEGRAYANAPYPPFARGTLSATSATTDNNGIATVYFTVTQAPGDNFRIAASTDSQYLSGVQVAGDELADANNVSLSIASKAKQTNILTVWRKVHLEVDSMGQILGNVHNGTLPASTLIDVGQQPVWLTVMGGSRSLLEGRYRGSQNPDGTWRLLGGRLSLGFGSASVQVLDNTDKAVLVKSETGVVHIEGNQQYSLYDDDDYNSDDYWWLNGDEQEDVDFRYDYTGCLSGNETLSRLCASSNVNINPYAAAYIEPDYEWAKQQSGMNDTDVPSQIVVYDSDTDAYSSAERNAIEQKRDSDAMESNDFWIGYILLGYQARNHFDPPVEALLGSAPAAGIPQLTVGNRANSFQDVRIGCIGAILFLETMRDVDVTDPSQNARIKTAPHELGHQFGLGGHNDEDIDWGLMSYTNSTALHPEHIKLLRLRRTSPGK